MLQDRVASALLNILTSQKENNVDEHVWRNERDHHIPFSFQVCGRVQSETGFRGQNLSHNSKLSDKESRRSFSRGKERLSLY